jgi:ketosteroid isomerase-like protein
MTTKKTTTSCLFLATLFLMLSTVVVHAQSGPSAQPRYKDMVGENPSAEADIKTASDYINALQAGDLAKMKSLLADNYKGYGPGPLDSANAEQELKNWGEGFKTQLDRKVNFIAETFRVMSGDLKGNWVSIWGDYSFTQNGKTAKFPFQSTMHVTNGKIDSGRTYYDRLYIMQTMGYVLTPPAGSK